jgi:hypothetical protein
MTRSIRDVLEVVTAILLGLVSVATALGAYQASVWAGQASELGAVSQQLRDRNLSEALTSQLIFTDDGGKLLDLVGLDSEITLYPDREPQLRREQDVLLESSSPELADAWTTWVAAGYPDDLVPMQTPEYEAALFAPAQSMQYVSFVTDRAAERVGEKSGQVTLAAVLFAIALLLLGVAGVNQSWRVAAVLSGGAAIAFLVGVVIVLLAVV